MANKKVNGGSGGGAAAVFGLVALMLTGLLGFFDAMFVRASLQERAARNQWEQVPAVVTVSKVEVSRGSESDTYTPRIHFQYSVNGRDHTGKRYAFLDHFSAGERHALRQTEAYPVGSRVTAYVHPSDPTEAVLSVDGSAFPKIVLLFLTPFHCAAFALLAAAFNAARRRRNQGELSDLEYKYIHYSDAHHFVIRKRPWAPQFTFLVALGALGFLASFAVAFGKVEHLSPQVLVACVVIAAAMARQMAKRAARPEHFLHVDRESLTFAYPADGEPIVFTSRSVVDVQSSMTGVTVNDQRIYRHEIRFGEGPNATTMFAFKGPIEEGEQLRGIIDSQLDQAADAAAAA